MGSEADFHFVRRPRKQGVPTTMFSEVLLWYDDARKGIYPAALRRVRASTTSSDDTSGLCPDELHSVAHFACR